MNNNNQKKKSSQKKNTPRPKPSKASPKEKVRERAAARYTDAAGTVGLRDLMAHKMSWIAGYVYVGNGTNGANDDVYFRCAGNTSKIVVNTSGAGSVPVLSSDTRVGATYVRDVAKHYARKVVKSCRLRLVSLNPATTNAMMVAVAPIRGVGQSGSTILSWAATTAGLTLADTVGMTGVKSCASYESLSVDLTPFVAGGSGPKQNEFNINQDGEFTDSTWGDAAMDLNGICPVSFCVAGTSATSGLRGTNTHLVIIDQVVDLLDFVAGNTQAAPESLFSRYDAEDRKILFRLAVLSGNKQLKDSLFFKDLYASLRGQVITSD